MKHHAHGNYLKMYRKKSGLSQREMGMLLGYTNQWQVSRHERGHAVPPLRIALGYEAIFQLPVSALFAGTHAIAARSVSEKLEAFERRLKGGGGSRRGVIAAAQKLEWLNQRRTRS